MSILEIKNLSHMYDDKVLFKGASLSVNNGEHAGIVGLNGAGKSTFISILAGELMQDSGEVNWLNGIKREYLDQHADIDRSLTVFEYLSGAFAELHSLNKRMEEYYTLMETAEPEETEKLILKANNILDKLTASGYFELESRIKKTAAGLGIDAFGYDTVIGTLSGGQRAKLMLAKLLLSEPDMMLLDEPTNFLDIEHIEWLSEFLSNSPKTFLVISHDTEFLDKVCKCIINIENGEIKKYGGNYTQFLAQREQNAKQYEESYIRQQREREKLEDYIRRNGARVATAGMANAKKKQLDKMEILRPPAVVYDAEFAFPLVPLHTKELLTVKDLLIGYDEPLLPPISFTLSSEDKLWLRGTNGIGKTTFVKTLMGLLRPKGGEFAFHSAVKTGYLEQDSAINECTESPVAYIGERFVKLNLKDVRAALARVGIKNELASRRLCDMSGGEQVRVRLCALCQRVSNILILDEPTNHLDVRAKEALKKALIDYKGAVLLVSHEKDFAGDICSRVFDCRV